jgi:hypothetical protein
VDAFRKSFKDRVLHLLGEVVLVFDEEALGLDYIYSINKALCPLEKASSSPKAVVPRQAAVDVFRKSFKDRVLHLLGEVVLVSDEEALGLDHIHFINMALCSLEKARIYTR